MISVASYGAYIPRLRLSRRAVVASNAWFNGALRSRGKGERAMCNWDEDALTMAVEAARGCLRDVRKENVGGLFLASTSLPFDARQSSAVVSQALNVGPDFFALDVAHSQRAGLTALMCAADKAASSRRSIMVVGSERRRAQAGSMQELQMGDGAAALLLTNGPGIARILAARSETVDFVDHYRGQGREFDYHWEQRWIRDEGYLKIVAPVVAAALEDAGVEPSAVDRFCLPSTLPRVAESVAKLTGIPEAALCDNLQEACGDTGAAHPLLMFIHALEQSRVGDKILVAAFGQGSDAVLFEVTAAPKDAPAGVAMALAAGKPELNYAKYLAFNNLIKLDKGLRSEVDKQTPLTTLYRNRKMLIGLIGGVCRECGTPQFPKSKICVKPQCGAWHSQDDYAFSELEGCLRSYTADQLTFTPDPPACYGMVEFASGGRLMADLTDVEVEDLAVGTSLRMVFRIKDIDHQRGFPRYFWKARPVREARGA